jgi:alkylation response protein AidB-like acyl-CoA dehydrogenase
LTEETLAEKFVSERNIKFLLYEVFDVASLLKYPRYADHSRDTFDMILETALKLGKDLFKPTLQEMDKNQPEFVDGRVKVHPKVKEIMQICGAGGWISATAPQELGGQELPVILGFVPMFIFSAANYAGSVYPYLTAGAAHLIYSFGNEELINTYIPKMYAGDWQGTMALTEPQAGSSLSDITTLAEPSDHGYYRIRGQKIFISTGDHDGVQNVVHLLLARMAGAPPGVKGISLFVVPKMRPDDNGKLVSNDVQVAGIYHKMGYRGAPITQLSFGENDDCRGYLVGQPNRGLSHMFQLMNEARIAVGIAATGIASAAYYAALEYSSERPQGRPLAAKDPLSPQVPIIEHPDVKRMLLFQRAVVEGSLSLLMQCGKYVDLERILEGKEKEKYGLLLEILTPVAKSYPAEMGILAVSQALQCLGGYGYCDEFPLEQLYRDARIHPIHEGTTGIQGLDLLGRKVPMKNGEAAMMLIQEIEETIAFAKEEPELQPCARELKEATDKLKKVTAHLVSLAMQGKVDLFLADSTLYLEFFGIITIGWQWLLQAIAARKALRLNPTGMEMNFYQGKLYTFEYFFQYELPKIEGLAKSLFASKGITVEMKIDFF